MTDQTRVLSINGSYRDDGITDQAVTAVTLALTESGVHVDTVNLRDEDIRFCLNCRACTQQPGEQPGLCVLNDSMRGIIDKIEQADAYILAAPTNFGSATAVFKRFMERLIVYGFWPWGAPSPVFRKAESITKKALLVTSCAAPGILGRLTYSTSKQLKMTAKLIGAKPVGLLYTGLIAGDPKTRVSARTMQKAETLAQRLH